MSENKNNPPGLNNRAFENRSSAQYPEFSEGKKNFFKKHLTESDDLNIKNCGFKMLSLVEVSTLDGGVPTIGYIVGFGRGKNPHLIICVPNDSGTETVNTLTVPVTQLNRIKLFAQKKSATLNPPLPPNSPIPPNPDDNGLGLNRNRAAAASSSLPPNPPGNPPNNNDKSVPTKPLLRGVGELPPPNEPPPMSDEELKLRRAHLKKLTEGIYKDGPQKIDIRISDLSAWMEELAELVAENKMRAYLNEQNFVKRAIAHIDEDSYREKFYRDTLHAMQSSRNLKASLEARVFGRGEVISSDPFVQETLARFDEVLSRFEQGLHEKEEEGEPFVADPELNTAAINLFIDNAMGRITDRVAFDHRVEKEVVPLMLGRKFAQGGLSTMSEKDNRMHASNLWHWSETFKEQIQQLVVDTQEKYGEKDPECIKRYIRGVLNVDFKFHTYKKGRSVVNRDPNGDVLSGQNKVSKLDWQEKIVSRLQKNIGWSPVNKVLGVVVANPVAMGIIGTIAGRAGFRMIAGATVGVAAAPVLGTVGAGILVGGLAAGYFAKIRAQKELKQDRGMVARDRALGRTQEGVRAKEMEKYVHEMESAEKVIADLQKISGEELANTPEGREALAVIANARALLEIRIQYGKDTLRTSAEEGEKYLSLDHAIDQIKLEFRRIGALAEKTPELVAQIDRNKAEFLEKVKISDKEFEKFLSRKSWRKTLMGAGAGVLGGACAAGLHHMLDGTEVGNLIGKAVSYPRKLASYMFGGGASTPMPGAGPKHNGVFDFFDQPSGKHVIPCGKGSLELPANRIWVDEGNGNGHVATIFGRQVSPSMHINPDGSVAAPSGTGEHQNLIYHTERVIPGQEYAQKTAEQTVKHLGLTQKFKLPENLKMFEDPITHEFELRDVSGKVIEKGLQIGPDGKLTQGTVDMLNKHGWNITDNNGYSTAGTKHYDKKALTEHLRRNYGQSKAHRLDWHDNDTPMRQVGRKWTVDFDNDDSPPVGPFTKQPPQGDGWTVKQIAGGRWTGADGKELLLKLEGTPNSRILSLKDMIKQSIAGARNADGSVDGEFDDIKDSVFARKFAEAAKHFKLRVFVGDNYTGSGESFELPLNAQGEFCADEHPELAGILFDKDGNLKATVEAIIPEDDGSGYHTLATAVRHGDGQGLVTERELLIGMTHPPENTIQHAYLYDEVYKPTTVASASADDPSFIFPLWWTPRYEMEKPVLDANDKMGKNRTPLKPLMPPPYRSNKELSRALVKDHDFDKTIRDEAMRRTRIDSGVDGKDVIDPNMKSALEQYADSNGIKLTESNSKYLVRELEEARLAEEYRPLVWNKPFTFDIGEKNAENPSGQIVVKDSLGNALPFKAFEQRLAFADPRPDKISLIVGETMLSKTVFDEEQIQLTFGKEIAKKLGSYGVVLEFKSAPAPSAPKPPKKATKK